MSFNFSSGNFRGASSTLGYSLFDHAQKIVACPSSSPDPLIRYYCKARAALGPHQDPTAYTAWVIEPAMLTLHEPFFQVTNRYTALSLKLIARRPDLYARTVSNSFVDFWTGDVPMVLSVLLGGGLRQIMIAEAPAERVARDAVALAFFLAMGTALALRIAPDRDGFLFCFLTVTIVMTSSVLQALVESGRETPRFAIPTEPLLIIAIVYLFARIRRPRDSH